MHSNSSNSHSLNGALKTADINVAARNLWLSWASPRLPRLDRVDHQCDVEQGDEYARRQREKENVQSTHPVIGRHAKHASWQDGDIQDESTEPYDPVGRASGALLLHYATTPNFPGLDCERHITPKEE